MLLKKTTQMILLCKKIEKLFIQWSKRDRNRSEQTTSLRVTREQM